MTFTAPVDVAILVGMEWNGVVVLLVLLLLVDVDEATVTIELNVKDDEVGARIDSVDNQFRAILTSSSLDACQVETQMANPGKCVQQMEPTDWQMTPIDVPTSIPPRQMCLQQDERSNTCSVTATTTTSLFSLTNAATRGIDAIIFARRGEARLHTTRASTTTTKSARDAGEVPGGAGQRKLTIALAVYKVTHLEEMQRRQRLEESKALLYTARIHYGYRQSRQCLQ